MPDGLRVAPVASGRQPHLPWFIAGLGVLLAVLGLVLASGRSVRVPRPGARTHPQRRSLTRWFASVAGFGAGYVLANDPLVRRLRRSDAWVPRFSGVLPFLAGLYIAYGRWELRILAGADPDDPVISAAATAQHQLVATVRQLGATGWLIAVVALVAVALTGTWAKHRRVDGPA